MPAAAHPIATIHDGRLLLTCVVSLFLITGLIAVERLISPLGTTDFDGFYAGGRDLLEHADPYASNALSDDRRSDVRRYLPFFSFVMAPLALLPLPVAGAVWHIVSCAAMLRCVVICLRWTACPPSRWWLAAAVTTGAVFLFAWSHLILLQVGLPVLWLTLEGMWLVQRGRQAAGGVLLALATAMKVTPAIFLPYLLLRRRWRAAAAMGAGFILLCAATAIPMGPRGALDAHLRWLRDYGATAGSAFFTGPAESLRYNNASLPAVLRRTLMEEPQSCKYRLGLASLPPRAVAAIAMTLKLAAMCLLCLVALERRREAEIGLAEVGMVLGLVVVFTPIAWTHHFVTLMPALASLWSAGDRISRRWLAGSVLLQLSLLHPITRAIGGLMLSDLCATAGAARLALQPTAARTDAPAPQPGRC